MIGIKTTKQLEKMVGYINEDLLEMPDTPYFTDMARTATLLSILTVPAEDAEYDYREAAIELHIGNAPIAGKFIPSPIDDPGIHSDAILLPHSQLILRLCVELIPTNRTIKRRDRYPTLYFGTEPYIGIAAMSHTVKHGGLVQLCAPDKVTSWFGYNSYHLKSVKIPDFLD